MKKILILGGGTAGTIMANKLASALRVKDWQITLVDESDKHYYQPGFLFIPFGIYGKEDVIKPSKDFYPSNIDVIKEKIELISPKDNQVSLKNGQKLDYHYLIIATGCRTHPEEIEGMKGDGWFKNIFDFYTIEGSLALGSHFKNFKGGKLVINIAEMPIKCPVAPLEFAFLADYFFTKMGVRDNIEIEYVTPLPGAFTKPICSENLGHFLKDKNIKLTTEFDIGSVDNSQNKIISYDNKEISYDCLVTVPPNMGAQVIADSDMGDDLNFIPTDKGTLRANDFENIFVIGDATDLPASKAGSVAHFQADILFENVMAVINNKPIKEKFDGHANCFIETGFEKGLLIDFNYDTEPLLGKFPLPVVGPFSLLKETRVNHWGKMMFRWFYWNILLKGVKMPIPHHMTMMGKERPNI